jgi:hypothetical protein
VRRSNSATLPTEAFYSNPTKDNIMAIINNTEARFHSVPTKNGGASIKLAPGFNEVKDEAWASARGYVLDNLANGIFVELGVEVKSGKDGKGDTIEGKPYHKFSFAESEKIIKGTFFIPTLEDWKATCPTESLRSVIMNQIERVNKEAVQTKTRSEG